MELILWRHAEAQAWAEGNLRIQSDLDRALTPRGEKQAARMAEWLDRQLPGRTRILVSPARRCPRNYSGRDDPDRRAHPGRGRRRPGGRGGGARR